MENSRISRKLGITFETTKDARVTTVEKPSDESTLSKEELNVIFQQEINALVEEKIQAQKKLLTKELKVKFDLEFKKLESDYHVKCQRIEEQQKTLSELIDSITYKYREEVSNNISQMDGILIEIVMESLYKILGEKDAYEQSISKVVRTLTTKQLANTKISMKVSEESFKLLSNLYKDNSILNYIQLDNSLTAGQIRIDDGISIIATGLIDQLDYLKNILLGQLREIHGL